MDSLTEPDPFTELELDISNRVFPSVAAINAAYNILSAACNPEIDRGRLFRLASARRLLVVEDNFLRLLEMYHPL